MTVDRQKKPRRALDLNARRAITEFRASLGTLDLPPFSDIVPFSYEAPGFDRQWSVVKLAVILAGVPPPRAEAERGEVRERLRAVCEECRRKAKSSVTAHVVWEAELDRPGGDDAPREWKRIREAVEFGGWTLSEKNPPSAPDLSYSPHVRFAAASHIVARRSLDDAFAAVQMPDGRGAVYAVADGVGGRRNAGLFAAMAVQQALRGAYGVPSEDILRSTGDVDTFMRGR